MRSTKRIVLSSLLAGYLAYPALGASAQDGARIASAPPADWLSYGRDYAETRYSPLNQITTANVNRLGLAWTWDMDGPAAGGGLQATPLVSNGVMYFTAGPNVVYALDTRTGRPKWRWDPGHARQGAARNGPNRGVALYNGKVYVGLYDGRLVALNAETGQPVWSRQTTPYGQYEYNITGAPRVVDGKVVIGNGGAEYHGVRGYVTAYDAETGEQAWRFYTVPGDPSLPFEHPELEMAARTWSGEWWKFGGGGTAWDALSYDSEANLLYIGTGNGAPWNYQFRSNGIGDNLFLNSVVAVNASTGRMVWYYQTVPGDSWDWTTTQQMTLMNINIGGRERRVLMTAPKHGFVYVLDRLTGELLSAEKLTPSVNWADRIDMATGRPVMNPAAQYDERGAWVSPGGSAWGAHNWYPMSYHPRTGLVYIPGQNTSQFYQKQAAYTPVLRQFSTGTNRNPQPTTPAPDVGSPGFLVARDPVTNRDRWKIPYERGRNGGTMTSGENLLFSLQRNGFIYAHNATTGDKLWEFAVGGEPVAPITYEVDGRQYVSVLAGAQGLPGRVWTFVLDGNARSPIPPPAQ